MRPGLLLQLSHPLFLALSSPYFIYQYKVSVLQKNHTIFVFSCLFGLFYTPIIAASSHRNTQRLSNTSYIFFISLQLRVVMYKLDAWKHFVQGWTRGFFSFKTMNHSLNTSFRKQRQRKCRKVHLVSRKEKASIKQPPTFPLCCLNDGSLLTVHSTDSHML